ncbi:MAG: hypothetical protein IRZ18_05980 [Clostridia bacterium]|nr:hypothetical protein [Clostridia bacterium]
MSVEAFSAKDDIFVQAFYRRVLGGQPDRVQVFFDAAVLERYRGKPGFTLQRTNTAGRLKQAGGFSLDFGIAADDALIHLPAADLASRLPESEREHWLAHLVTLPHSRHFVRVQMTPGSCFDDGEIREF